MVGPVLSVQVPAIGKSIQQIDATHWEVQVRTPNGVWVVVTVPKDEIVGLRQGISYRGLEPPETGFDVRLAYYMPPGSKIGHAWVEVGASGTPAFIVDPMEGQLLTWKETVAEAANPSSLAGRWYTQPEHQFVRRRDQKRALQT